MSIQQNVNQLLAMAGTAAMLNPKARQKIEDRKALTALEKETAEYEAGVNALRDSRNEQFKATLKNVSPLLRELRSPDFDYSKLSSEEISGYLDKLKETEHLWDPENARYQAEEQYFEQSRKNLDKKKLHLLEERARIQPTPENLKALQREQKIQSGAYYVDGKASLTDLTDEDLAKEYEAGIRSKQYRREQGLEPPKEASPAQEKLTMVRANLQKRQQAMKHMTSSGQAMLEQKEAFKKFRESLDKDDIFHSLSPKAQKIAYEQYTNGGKNE